MKQTDMDLGWLYRLAAARQLHAEAELRAVLDVLEQMGLAPDVLARPELTGVEPRERTGIDAVLRVPESKLRSATDRLRAEGWTVLPDRAQSRGTRRFSRAGVLIAVTVTGVHAAESEATLPEPRWRERLRAAYQRLRGRRRQFRFLNRDLLVHAGVFTPGPFSERTVQLALQQIEGRHAPRVIDVGTGTGALALSVGAARRDARVLAVDISAAAVRNARQNARRLRLNNVLFLRAELLPSVPAEWPGQVDLIVANLPYIPGIVCEHAALRGINWRGPLWSVHGQGGDGLELQRRLARQATSVLRPGGALVLEVDGWQSPIITAELVATGYTAWEATSGLVAARWAAADR